MWLWKRRRPREGFPADFSRQKIRNASDRAVSHLSAPELAAFLRQNPLVAQELLTESSDKRFTPSTFLAKEGDEYNVGWLSRRLGYQCERRHAELADAATDYVLFSLGKCRWSPPEA